MRSPDLRAIEAGVTDAIATGNTDALHIVGHGEISLVLGWPPDRPEVVCKRLPPFAGVPAFEAYADVVVRYVEELRTAGVHVVETELRYLVRPDGSVVGFHVQPLLPTRALATSVLRGGDRSDGLALLDSVTDVVVAATSDRIGVDAQLSNWIWLDGVPWQIDLTTPFLLDEARRPCFDLTPFLAMLPAVVRPLARREMTRLMLRWTTARGALLDLAANLMKERLDEWLDPTLRTINARVSPPITPREAGRVHRGDRRLWPLLFRLEHLNRWWQRRVRRRPFDFLLPEHTTYEEGPLDPGYRQSRVLP